MVKTAKLAVRALVFTLLLPGGVTTAIPYFILTSSRSLLRADVGSLAYLGLPLLALGAAIYLWCVAEFIRAQGTPAPIDPPKEMVARGLYQYVRNPMYLGVLCVVLGEAIFFGSGLLALYALILFAAFHLFVTGYEEPHLRRIFGAAYQRYCADVPRWMPRLRQGRRI